MCAPVILLCPLFLSYALQFLLLNELQQLLFASFMRAFLSLDSPAFECSVLLSAFLLPISPPTGI